MTKQMISGEGTDFSRALLLPTRTSFLSHGSKYARNHLQHVLTLLMFRSFCFFGLLNLKLSKNMLMPFISKYQTHGVISEYGSNDFRLQYGSTEDLFSNSQAVYDQLKPLSLYFNKLCKCDQGKSRCSYKQYNDCKTKIKGKEYHCLLHSAGSDRKRRNLRVHHAQFTENNRESLEVAVSD